MISMLPFILRVYFSYSLTPFLSLSIGKHGNLVCQSACGIVVPSYSLCFMICLVIHPLLLSRNSGEGSAVQLSLGEEFSGFLFVLKLNDGTWINDMGDDFYIPLPSSGNLITGNREDQSDGVQREVTEEAGQQESMSAFTDGIINEIRHLVTDISSEKNRKTKSKEAQESILQEIEKLAAEAYSIFRSSVTTFAEEAIVEAEAAVESKTLISLDLPPKISSGTGAGFEILCQGFNWESHKSGRWYMELKEKAA